MLKPIGAAPAARVFNCTSGGRWLHCISHMTIVIVTVITVVVVIVIVITTIILQMHFRRKVRSCVRWSPTVTRELQTLNCQLDVKRPANFKTYFRTFADGGFLLNNKFKQPDIVIHAQWHCPPPPTHPPHHHHHLPHHTLPTSSSSSGVCELSMRKGRTCSGWRLRPWRPFCWQNIRQVIL